MTYQRFSVDMARVLRHSEVRSTSRAFWGQLSFACGPRYVVVEGELSEIGSKNSRVVDRVLVQRA